MCPTCGVTHDRDMNASMNLELVAVSSLEASRLPAFAGRTVTVCGEESSDGRLALVVKLSSEKQKSKRGIKGHAWENGDA
jgi:transposase